MTAKTIYYSLSHWKCENGCVVATFCHCLVECCLRRFICFLFWRLIFIINEPTAIQHGINVYNDQMIFDCVLCVFLLFSSLVPHIFYSWANIFPLHFFIAKARAREARKKQYGTTTTAFILLHAVEIISMRIVRI